MSSDRYAYAVGRVRAMETRLLDRGKIDRMVESSSGEEALKVLGETEYAEHLAALKSIYDYDDMLEQELRRVYVEIRRFTPDQELINLFTRKFDYHNLKVFFKAHKLGETREDLLVKDIGNIPLPVLRRAVEEDDFRDLPNGMRTAAEQLSEAFRLEANPQLVDLLLDRAMFLETMESVEKLGSSFLKKYFIYYIDLLNIKTYLRVKRSGKPREFLEQALLPCGELDMSRLVQLIDPLEVLLDRLLYSPYIQVLEDGIQWYQKTDSLTRLEKLMDDFLLGYIKKAKYITFGPEPIAAYLLAKENEVKLIRIIMVGKLNRLPVPEIKERLREVYA